MIAYVVAVFACYRIVRLLTWDFGPGDVFVRFREWVGTDRPETQRSFWGHLFACPYCLGMYVALPLAFVVPVHWGVAWLGIAGGQFFVEWMTHGRNDLA